MFKLLKGKKDGPPDIGQEEEYGTKVDGAKVIQDSEEDVPALPVKKVDASVKSKEVSQKGGGAGDLRVERLNARVDSVVEWLKQFSERFAYINENLGEIRATAMATEKRLTQATAEADKVVDVVREVKPQQLRIEYQKMDLKIAAINEKMEANKQLMLDTMNEVNDIRRQSEIFVGTEGLVKLNKDTKKDLVEMRKLSSRTKMQGDKVQEVFLEVGKNFADTQKAMSEAEMVKDSFDDFKKDFERLKMDHKQTISRNDLASFKREYGSLVEEVRKMKLNYEKLNKLAETSLDISRRNQDDIGDVALKVGDSSVKKISDYEAQMDDLLGLISMLTEEVNELKAGAGKGRSEDVAKAIESVAARRGEGLNQENNANALVRIPAPIVKKVPVAPVLPAKIEAPIVEEPVKKKTRKVAKKKVAKKVKKETTLVEQPIPVLQESVGEKEEGILDKYKKMFG
ncbi:hypothetical protein HNV12_00010 [Methanococcoides sp. SA1]|nr:hypothetical protein [Methanococcoides sp. SA1]